MEDNYFNTAHLGLTQSINNSFIRNESSYYLVSTTGNLNTSRCFYASPNGTWTMGFRVAKMNYSIYYNINQGFVTDNKKADYVLFPVIFKTADNITSNTYFGIAYYCVSARSLNYDFYYEYYNAYNSGFCSLNYSENGGSSALRTAALVETSNNFNKGFLVDNEDHKRIQNVDSTHDDICFVSKCYSFGSTFNYAVGFSSYKIYVTGESSSNLIKAYTSPTKDYVNAKFNEGFEEGKISGGSGGLSLIGESFEKMGSLLSIQILPNFTIGALISIPLMFILLTFMIRMFKGGN